MRSRNAPFLIIAGLCAQLFFSRTGAGEVVEISDRTPREQILNLISVTHHYVLVTFYRVILEGKMLGALLVYDDPETKRSEDYLELYDNDTNLVAVRWFDHFGIERITVDRSLFDDESKLQGVFVTLLSGDSL
jgi:hypothetical protein